MVKVDVKNCATYVDLRYTDSLMHVYCIRMTHLPSFVSFCGRCVYTGIANSNFCRHHQNKILFSFFRIPRRVLLDNGDIYTSTLIFCNSLNANLINTKVGTVVHLLLFYHPFELCGQTLWYQCSTALC